MEKDTSDINKKLAIMLALHGVRNTFLEDLHAGTFPATKAGDCSDVKVVSPYGEIPWQNLSRISDEEMKMLMMEIVNKIYGLLHFIKECPEDILEQVADMNYKTVNWSEPELDEDFVKNLGEYLDDLKNFIK